MKNIFVKQSYTSFKVLFGMVFFICLILTILTAVRNKHIQYSWILFDVFVMIFCVIISKLLDGFGLYINNQNIYYKKFFKHAINLNSICAIKIIRAEVDGKFGRRWVKDAHGNPMYSMIFLSNVENAMYSYQQGDTMFMHEFRNNVLFYTVLDKLAIEHLISLNKDIKII